MTDINHVILVGRLVRDADVGYTKDGQARANISIAVNRNRKQGDQWVEEAHFFDATIWGKTADNLRPYLTKGKQIAIEGSLRQDRWEKDGKTQSKVTINADNVQLLGGRSDGGQQSGGYTPRFQQSAPAAQAPSQYQDSPYNGDSGFSGSGSDFPEDVPF